MLNQDGYSPMGWFCLYDLSDLPLGRSQLVKTTVQMSVRVLSTAVVKRQCLHTSIASLYIKVQSYVTLLTSGFWLLVC